MKHFRILPLTVALLLSMGCNRGRENDGAIKGEFCGGIAGITCETGLTCVLEGDYPDAGGICQ